MAEILTGAEQYSLLETLRVPAVSRLQKLHNVGISLRAWRDAGVTIGEESPHHIVDGQRSAVVKMIWRIVSHFCFLEVLDLDQVEDEVLKLRGEHRGRIALSSAMECSAWGVQSSAHCVYQSSSLDARGKALLLSWCEAVCGLYGLPISDFASSFADGKALCLLIHHYHPFMLSLDEIRLTTRDINDHATLSRDTAIYNEKLNSALAHRLFSELGGIPCLVPTSDSTTVPDEKAMMVYACYICSRLLSSQGEVQACQRIQTCFRRGRLRQLEARKMKAAALILTVWRLRRLAYFQNQEQKYSVAVKIIEHFVLSSFEVLRRSKGAREHKALAIKAAVLVQVRASSWRLAFLIVCQE
jgi:abnormal spindle-like microcephaly-associated protein